MFYIYENGVENHVATFSSYKETKDYIDTSLLNNKGYLYTVYENDSTECISAYEMDNGKIISIVDTIWYNRI